MAELTAMTRDGEAQSLLGRPLRQWEDELGGRAYAGGHERALLG